MFGQSLLSAFGIACTTDTDQLFTTDQSITSTATYQLNASPVTSIPSNTYPGTASNITYAAGKFGNAAVFNGSSSKIDTNVDFSGSTATGATISFWFKTSNTSGQTILGSQTGNPSGFAYGSQIYLGNSFGGIPDESIAFINERSGYTESFLTREGSTAYADGNWHHAVFISTNSTKQIWIDGVSKTVYYYQSGSATAQADLIDIALGTSLSGNWFNGSIDQVRIFNTALPASAVTALYNETTTTASSASVDYQVANPNSIAYYKMADATDQLGNFNGTATNVNFNTEGKFGFAGAFNGSSSSFSFSNSVYGSSTTVFTASGWFKHTSSANSREDIYFGNGATVGGLSGYAIYTDYSTGNIGLSFRTNPNQVFYNSSTNIKDGNWHHVCLTYNNGVYVLYVDNVSILNGTSSYYLNNLTPSKDTFVGSRYGTTGAGTSIIGAVDQIRIYDSALSAADVTTLYKEVECEPAAINALANFNTVLYTGNSGTQAVTGVGFKPGFTWIKRRDNGTKWHNLFDSVRGVSERLFSNSSGAQSFFNQSLTSFDNNGFSVGNDADVNVGSIVAWNWKAPLANLSTSFNGSSSKIEANSLSISGNTSFSISLWVKPNNVSTEQWIIQYGASSGDATLYLQLDSNGFSVNNYTTGQVFSLSVTANTWYHCVIGYDSSASEMFIQVNNGTRVTKSATVNINASNLLMGHRSGASSYFNGSIAQVRIFNDALTTSEVSDLYTEPATSNNTLNYPAGAGCIAAYPLQTDAVDLSGNYSGASSNVTFGKPGYLTGNTDGTIPSTVAANVEAGFSIASYKGNGTQNATIGHGLTSPKLIIIKNTSQTDSWFVGSTLLAANNSMILDGSSGACSAAAFNYEITSTTFKTTSSSPASLFNANGENYIMYSFADIAGYSKIGSYVGNGSSQTLYTGFAVKFVLIKSTTSSQSWMMYDSTRGGNKYLEANSAGAEGSSGSNLVNFYTNGFGVSSSNSENQSGQTFIYLAIA
jgi:hypothetical protein